MNKLIKGGKLDMVNSQIKYKNNNNNFTIIHMETYKKNKKEIDKNISRLEVYIKELENSEIKAERIVGKQFRKDLELLKTLGGETNV